MYLPYSICQLFEHSFIFSCLCIALSMFNHSKCFFFPSRRRKTAKPLISTFLCPCYLSFRHNCFSSLIVKIFRGEIMIMELMDNGVDLAT